MTYGGHLYKVKRDRIKIYFGGINRVSSRDSNDKTVYFKGYMECNINEHYHFFIHSRSHLGNSLQVRYSPRSEYLSVCLEFPRNFSRAKWNINTFDFWVSLLYWRGNFGLGNHSLGPSWVMRTEINSRKRWYGSVYVRKDKNQVIFSFNKIVTFI